MSRLDSIPPDLSAVLSLLLRRGKRYAEVAGMLGIQEHAVHDRAHAALALLAPSQARGLSAAEREQLGEYLLGQQSAAAAGQTRDFLAGSAAGRTWAQALVSELAPLAARSLPAIPAAREATPSAARADSERLARTTRPPTPSAADTSAVPSSLPSSPTETPQQSSSRVGGAVVLGVLAAIAVVVVLLVVGVGGGGGSGGSHSTSQPSAAATTTTHAAGTGTGTSTSASEGAANTGTTGTSTTGTSTTGSSTGASATSHGKALELRPPDSATSKAVGVAYVLTQKSRHAFYVFAKGLPTPPSGTFYAVWLEGATNAPDYPLGSLPAASTTGLVEGGGPLPSSAGSYSHIIVTTESSHHPSHPGPTVLAGTFTLG